MNAAGDPLDGVSRRIRRPSLMALVIASDTGSAATIAGNLILFDTVIPTFGWRRS
jgi:Na+/H+ antiporter NhaD/arsenite permease-like protein